MKTNWQTKKFGEIILENKKSPLRSKGNKVGAYQFFVSGFKIKKIDKYLISGKSIFLPTGGNFFVHYFDGKAAYSTDTWSIKTKENADIRYLYYYLIFKQDFISKKLFKGATIKHLQKEDFKNIEISLPPLIEQNRIVKILDEVFEKTTRAKENAEKNLQNSEELFESYLQNIFANPSKDWQKKTLDEVSIYFGRGKSKHRPRNDKKLYGGEYPFIQTGDVRNCSHLITEYSQTYNEFGLAQSKLWPKGTICITIAANIAETGILNFDACFPDSVIGIVVNPKNTEINFVEYLLQSFKVRLQAKGKGSAQKNINLATFENELFPFPSFFEQKSIVKKLNGISSEIKKLETIYKQKLADLEELKKSVLKKVFAGELTESDIQKVGVKTPIVSPFFQNQVHAAIIGQVTKDGGSTTEVAVAKYDHLLQEICGLSLGYQFQTQQFGPFDAKIKKLVYSGLGKNKWFTKNKGMLVFGSNINSLLSKQSNLYHNAQSAMQELSKLGITKLDADKIELLSTVCHSVKETGSTALDNVRSFMSKWTTDNNRTKAEKFSSEQTEKCLNFVVSKNLHLKLL